MFLVDFPTHVLSWMMAISPRRAIRSQSPSGPAPFRADGADQPPWHDMTSIQTYSNPEKDRNATSIKILFFFISLIITRYDRSHFCRVFGLLHVNNICRIITNIIIIFTYFYHRHRHYYHYSYCYSYILHAYVPVFTLNGTIYNNCINHRANGRKSRTKTAWAWKHMLL